MALIGNIRPIKGVVSIARTAGNGTPGTTDTYTILYTDSSTSTFTITNGSSDSTLLQEITETKGKVDNINLEQVAETSTYKRLSNAMKLQVETIIDRLTSGIPVTGGGGGIVYLTPDANFETGVQSISNPIANEGSSLIFNVVLNSTTTENTDFTFVRSGNATASIDFTNSPSFSDGVTLLSGTADNGIIRVPTGKSSFTVTYSTVNDTIVEIQETLIITIGGVAGTGTILSDDVGVSVIVPEGTVPEGQPLFFDVFLTGRTTQVTVLPYTVGGTATSGVDYNATLVFDVLIDPELVGSSTPPTITASGGNITVPVGVASFRVRFNTIADATNEPEETVILTISGVQATGIIIADTQLLDVFSARIVEAPYYILTSPQKSGLSLVDGYGLALVERNQSGSTSENYNLRTSTDGTTYTPVADFNYNATASLLQPASKVAESFVFNVAFDFAGLTYPRLGFINDEIVEVTAYNSTTLTATVRRAVLDTVPQIHPIGSKLRVASAPHAIDTTERTDGTLVYYKTVPEFAGTPLNEANSVARQFTFDQRAARPYAPNRFQINSLFYPESVDGGNINISWQHRNRLDSTLIDYNDVNVSGGVTTSNFAIVNLTAGAANTLGSTQTTAVVTPATNRHLVLTVTTRIDIAGGTANLPTISGLGLTWTLVDTMTWDTSDPTHKRTSIFIAYGSGTTGSVTMNFGGQTQNNVNWVLDQINGLETVGTVVQTAKASTDSANTTAHSVTFAGGFDSQFNATYVAFSQDNTTQTGFTLEANLTQSGNSTLSNIQTVTAYKISEEPNCSISWNIASSSQAALAVEFRAKTTTVGGGTTTPIIISARDTDITTYDDYSFNVIRDYNPTAVESNVAQMYIGQFEQSLIRINSLDDPFFDGGVVTDAVWEFTIFDGSTNVTSIDVYRILQPYVASEVTYNNRNATTPWASPGLGADRTSVPDLTFNHDGLSGVVTITGTQLNNLIQSMIDLPNYGIYLRSDGGLVLNAIDYIAENNTSPRLTFNLTKGGTSVEPGTTYSVRIYDTNTLVRSVDGITGTNYIYTESNILADGDYQNVKVQLFSVRDGLNSFGVHEHSFTRPFTGIPVPTVINISGGTEGGNATFTVVLSGTYFDQVDYEYTLTGNFQQADIGTITYSSGVTQYVDELSLTYLSIPPNTTTFSIVIPILNDAITPETGENIILTIGNISNTINLVNV